MERCPLCRATLNGAETCRRCRAELQSVNRVEREGQGLTDAAMHALSLDDVMSARRLLRRALAVHSTPQVRALWRLATAASPPQRSGNEQRPGVADPGILSRNE
jgi:hypothetical protein